jgi:DNA-binding transcriptional regulator PaaX
MSLGLASRAIVEALLRSRDFCVPEGDVKRLLKGYGYSERSVYVYIHRLARRGVVNRHRVGTTVQLCLELKRLRDLGLILILLR